MEVPDKSGSAAAVSLKCGSAAWISDTSGSEAAVSGIGGSAATSAGVVSMAVVSLDLAGSSVRAAVRTGGRRGGLRVLSMRRVVVIGSASSE